LKNKFAIDLVKERGTWVISQHRMENIWRTGEASVLFPPEV
jgi:hypothetical protein